MKRSFTLHHFPKVRRIALLFPHVNPSQGRIIQPSDQVLHKRDGQQAGVRYGEDTVTIAVLVFLFPKKKPKTKQEKKNENNYVKFGSSIIGAAFKSLPVRAPCPRWLAGLQRLSAPSSPQHFMKRRSCEPRHVVCAQLHLAQPHEAVKCKLHTQERGRQSVAAAEAYKRIWFQFHADTPRPTHTLTPQKSR